MKKAVLKMASIEVDRNYMYMNMIYTEIISYQIYLYEYCCHHK